MKIINRDSYETLKGLVESQGFLIDRQQKEIGQLIEERNYYKALATGQGPTKKKASVLKLVNCENFRRKEKVKK